MGPIILLDKSALQSLSRDEIGFLGKHYSAIMPPVLLFEILGDLSKYEDKGEEHKFVQIARKITSGDFKINTNHRELCRGSLLGYPVAMQRVPIVSGGVPLTATDGKKGVFFDEPKEWKLIRKWQEGKHEMVDRVIARVWRKIPKEFDMEKYKKDFKESNQDIPKATSLTEVYQSVHAVTMDPVNQDFYLDLVCNEFNISPNERVHIYQRWSRRQHLFLCDFAPYAFYCLTVFLMFHFGLANDLITTRRTNPIDLEYFFYLPFCMVFVSGDEFQRDLSRIFLNPKQDFVESSALKADLAWLKAEWENLDKAAREERFYDYGPHPPQYKRDSVTFQMWKKHMKPWKPGSGNIRMTKEQEKRLLDQMRPMFDAIKEYEKGRDSKQ